MKASSALNWVSPNESHSIVKFHSVVIIVGELSSHKQKAPDKENFRG